MSYALFVLGNALKKSKKVSDGNIPCILGIVGIVLCTAHIFAAEDFYNIKMAISAILRGFVRGICVAGIRSVSQSGQYSSAYTQMEIIGFSILYLCI